MKNALFTFFLQLMCCATDIAGDRMTESPDNYLRYCRTAR